MITLTNTITWPKTVFGIVSWLPICIATSAGMYLLLVAHTAYPGYAYRPPAGYAGYELLHLLYGIGLWSSPFLFFVWLAGALTLRQEFSLRSYVINISLFIIGWLVLASFELIEPGTWYWLLG